MSYRANPTDLQQSVLESTANKQGISVFEDGKTRVVAKGNQTSPVKTQHGSAVGNQRNNAGVVIPHDDQPNRFVAETQGKA